MSGGQVTIGSVAARARVSRQTVSNVLNTPERVRADTRQRVLAAIEELGYRPNRAARALRTHRSERLAFRMEPFGDGANGSVMDRFLHALTERAEAVGYRVMLFTAADDEGEITAYEELLARQEVDAFVLTGTHYGDSRTDWLRQRDVPFVTFGRPWGATAAHSWVDVDGAAGTAAVTRGLLDASHRRIAFVGWPEGSGVGDDRRSGWATSMRARGIDPQRWATTQPDSFVGGQDAAAELLGRPEPPTAFVCVSDSLALGVLAALAARGLRPGPELPVIGFDDTPVAAAVGLTSVAQPLGDAAARCVESLTRRLGRSAPTVPVHDLLPPHLVVRSTGGAASAVDPPVAGKRAEHQPPTNEGAAR